MWGTLSSIAGIFTVVAIILFVVSLMANLSAKEKREETKNDLATYVQRNNIPSDSKTIGCVELNGKVYHTKDRQRNKLLDGRLFNVWKEQNKIILCESFYWDNPRDFVSEKTIIPIDNIKFFTREGEYRVDNIVEGGGVNLKGAIVGGVIAGDAGAVLGGREKITTKQKEVDKRQTYLYYIQDNQEKRIVLFSEGYDTLLELIPNKDFSYIEKNKIVESSNTSQSNETKENTVYKDIEELAKLKDKGILTEEEFTEKKKILLEKIQ